MTSTDGGRTPDEQARGEAARAAENAILGMARAAGAEITARKPYGPDSVTIASPAPGAGIRYALMLRDAAIREICEQVKYARQDGMTWAQIGEALGLAGQAEESGAWIADLAFDFAAGAEHARPFQTLMVSWKCLACSNYIHDRGPAGGHPEDDEPGHAEGCARLAALVAEYEAEWAND